MIKKIKFSLFIGCAFLISACTSSTFVNDSSLEKRNQNVQITKGYMKIAADKEENITLQRTLEGAINSLATQMMRNKKFSSVKPVIITSFVKLSQLKKTTEFGRIISESLINELSNNGFNVIEFRGQLAVSINNDGEYFISRKVRNLKNKIPDTYVVVGTYSRQIGKIILNARVIDNITGKIITSARSTFAHGKLNDCIFFGDCKPIRTIKIIDEKEKN